MPRLSKSSLIHHEDDTIGSQLDRTGCVSTYLGLVLPQRQSLRLLAQNDALDVPNFFTFGNSKASQHGVSQNHQARECRPDVWRKGSLDDKHPSYIHSWTGATELYCWKLMEIKAAPCSLTCNNLGCWCDRHSGLLMLGRRFETFSRFPVQLTA